VVQSAAAGDGDGWKAGVGEAVNLPSAGSPRVVVFDLGRPTLYLVALP
jgi:hypothetical protein